jgi:NADH dehydrogenase
MVGFIVYLNEGSGNFESFLKRMSHSGRQRVVIVGAGFGGLYAARDMDRLPVDVTLLDKRNYHLFQPLLYQVATGGLSPGDISSPIRAILKKCRNVRVYQEEVVDIDPRARLVITRESKFPYDILVLATGSSHHYFGNDQWQKHAPGLKSIEDATDIRGRILKAFELAEKEENPDRRKELLRFVVVGGGPTGVELCGAMAELATNTMKGDFRNIDPARAEIILVEAIDRILPTFPEKLSEKAARSLRELGVTVRTGVMVTEVSGHGVTVKAGDSSEYMAAGAVIWAAGVKASSQGRSLAAKLGAETDRSERLTVDPDLSIPGHPEIFIIGDLANFPHQTGKPLPGLAPVAMQQGRYVAKALRARLRGKKVRPFKYWNKGTLAVIGRNAAVADFGKFKISGFPAWLLWIFVHIAYLIEYDNKLLVMVQWAWDYFTRKRGARLITWEDDTLISRASSRTTPDK